MSLSNLAYRLADFGLLLLWLVLIAAAGAILLAAVSVRHASQLWSGRRERQAVTVE
jgi:hypothetical protein